MYNMFIPPNNCYKFFGLENFPFIDKEFDSLTDYEKISKIFQYFEKKIQEVDDKYSEFGKEVENLKNSFETFKTDINVTLQAFETRINARLEQALIENRAEVLTLLNEYQTVFYAYVNSEISQVNDRIDKIEIGEIKVYNPLTGLNEPISDVINELYDLYRTGAITVTEFEELELTVNAFQNYNITAKEFDTNAKNILV